MPFWQSRTFFTHVCALSIGFLTWTVFLLAGLVEESKHLSHIPRVGKTPIPLWAGEPGNNVGIHLHYMPPAIFQRDTSAIIQTVPPDEIALYCGTEAAACQTDRADHPIVVMPNPCAYVIMPNGQRDPYASVLCHELGHANGWSHEGNDHPEMLSCDRWPAAWDSLEQCLEDHETAQGLDPRWCEQGMMNRTNRRLCAIRERFYQ